MKNTSNVSEKEIRDLIGKNLKRLRKKAGFSQLDLSGEANLSHTFINDIENGKKWVSCKTIARLCDVFQVEPSQLFFPISEEDHEQDQERSQAVSAYVDDLSNALLKNVEDFKNQYLGE